jgi:hypothetical protein
MPYVWLTRDPKTRGQEAQSGRGCGLFATIRRYVDAMQTILTATRYRLQLVASIAILLTFGICVGGDIGGSPWSS